MVCLTLSSSFFFLNASYASLFTMKLEKLPANDKIISKASYQSLQTTKMNFEKLLGEQVFKNHNFNLLQVCPSLLPYTFF